MSIKFTYNGKQVNYPSDKTFGALHDENDSGLFQQKDWTIDGKIQFLDNNAKIGQYVKNSSQVVSKQKATQNSMTLQPKQGNPQNDFSNFGQVKPQFPTPIFPTMSQQPIIKRPTFNQQREQTRDESGEKEISKQIHQFILTITDWGQKVILEQQDGYFKAVLEERFASIAEQPNIILMPEDVITDSAEQLHLQVGINGPKRTKAIFLKNYQGIAVEWSNGLKSKLSFEINISY